MGLNSPQEPQVDTIPSKEILTQTQKNVLDRILLILESDPKLRENLNIAFEKNLQSIIWDKDKFDLLSGKIGEQETKQLQDIESQFQRNEIDEKWAIEQSKIIITQYTNMKLSLLDRSIVKS